jgi:type IX secretion system PorP/SprF family membrane protein
MRKLLIIAVVFTTHALWSQNLQEFYSYNLYWANFNNAYVGSNNYFEGTLISRTQFNSIEGSPRNITALLSSGINENQGVGLKMINDSRGIFNLTRVDGIYSQKFSFNEEEFIRFGLSLGMVNSSIDLSDINNRDAVIATGDPVINSSEYNYTHFIAGFGVVYAIDQLEIGLAAPHILESQLGLEPYFLGTATYNYAVPGSDISVIPSVLFQNRPDDDNITEGFLNIGWRENIQLITGYTSDSRIKLGGGVTYKNISVNYINESPTGSNVLDNSTNEIGLSLVIGKQRKDNTSQIRSNISKLLNETRALTYGDYDKDYIRKRLTEIDQELDELLANNSSVNSREIAAQLSELEKQIVFLIEKYQLNK